MSVIKYKKAIGAYLKVESEDISLYSKGRVGLYAILKALNIKEGDEVIIPAFTCVVVANAIIYLKATPVYVDIDFRTYNLDPTKLEEAIGLNTKLIIAQNTFGLSPDYDALKRIADYKNINIIEDCTHGFGGTFKGQQNGTMSMASFFSTQWNKPFSTGIGGFVVANDPTLRDTLSLISKDLIKPSTKDEFVLRILILARKYLLIPQFYWGFVKLYRLLSKYNLVIGSSDDLEIIGVQKPNHYFKGSGKTQASEGLVSLNNLTKENEHRAELAKLYNDAFISLGIGEVFVPDYAHHTFIKFPFFVKDKNKYLAIAEKSKIPLGEWFVSPIHPVEKDFHLWQYDYGQFPIAEKISKHILNLPTDLSISKTKANSIVKFLIENKDHLLSYDSMKIK